MSTEKKTALFRAQADHLRSLAKKNPDGRLYGDLLRAAREWDEMAARGEAERTQPNDAAERDHAANG